MCGDFLNVFPIGRCGLRHAVGLDTHDGKDLRMSLGKADCRMTGVSINADCQNRHHPRVFRACYNGITIIGESRVIKMSVRVDEHDRIG
jgi:hypothetical protein